MDRQAVGHAIINGHNGGQMDSQIDKDKWTDQPMEIWTVRQTKTDGQSDRQRQMNRPTDGEMDRLTDGQTDRWTD